MDTTQYAAVLRALAYFAENASPSSAESLLREVTELTRGLANPRFKWTFDEQNDKYRLNGHGGVLLATVMQSKVTGRWLIYFPSDFGHSPAGSRLSFLEAQSWVESQF